MGVETMLAFSFKLGWDFNIVSITKTASRKIEFVICYIKLSSFEVLYDSRFLRMQVLSM